MDNRLASIKPGTIISGVYWPEPLEVNLIEDQGSYLRIVGVTTGKTKTHFDQIIPKDALKEISILLEEKVSFSEEAWKVFLAVETIRYRFASMRTMA